MIWVVEEIYVAKRKKIVVTVNFQEGNSWLSNASCVSHHTLVSAVVGLTGILNRKITAVNDSNSETKLSFMSFELFQNVDIYSLIKVL